jgi:predicted negative regulator of RcsB-dependent stress response
MSEATKRLRRKDLREPDEFLTLTGRLVDWSRQNAQMLAIAGGALVVLVIVLGVWSWVQQSRQTRASRAFYAADELYRREQWQEAESSFELLASDLPGTPYGRLARLYAGRAALRAGRNAEAVESLRQFLANPIDDRAMEQLARMNLGSALVAQGDVEGGRGELERALAIDGPARGEVTIELARAEESAGNRERALELYQSYLADDPNAVARDLARARILALGGTPPALPAAVVPGAPQITVQ